MKTTVVCPECETELQMAVTMDEAVIKRVVAEQFAEIVDAIGDQRG